MTITTQTFRAQYNGNGATTEFSIPFEFIDQTGVKVIHTDDDGVDTTWVHGTQYTITNNDGTPIVGRVQPATGKVVVDTSPTDYTPATGERLTILRNEPFTQAASYTENGPFPAKAHERALDRLDMQIHTLKEQINRSPKYAETSTNSVGLVFPEPEASKVIGWNTAGTQLENRDAAPGDGDMLASTYDPQGIQDDAFDRANHTGTQLAATISDLSAAVDARIANIVINVKDPIYGAVGDGVADDAPAIRAAIAAALSAGGEIYLPEGIYALATDDPGFATTILRQSSAGSSLTMKGAGREKSILKLDAALGSYIIYCKDLDGVHLSGFTVDCAGQTAGSGIGITDCDNVYIDAKVIDAFNNGILIDVDDAGCNNVVIDRPHVERPGGHGISLSGDATDGAGARVNDCRILHPYVFNPVNSGVNVSEAQRVLVEHPIVIHDATGGAHATGYAGVRITNGAELISVISPDVDGMDRGIFISKVFGWEIIGGNIRNSGQQAAFLSGKVTNDATSGALDGRMIGTKLYNPGQRNVGGNAQHAIYVGESTDNTFIGIDVEDDSGLMGKALHETNNSARNRYDIREQGATATSTIISALPKGIHILAQSAVGVSHTGDTNLTVLATITIPAGWMGLNGSLRITDNWSSNNDASVKTKRTQFNANTIQSVALTSLTGGRFQSQITNRNSASSQQYAAAAISGFGTTTSTTGAIAVDTSAARDITLSIQLADAADTVTLEYYLVELIIP